jgi:hypothetical protein
MYAQKITTKNSLITTFTIFQPTITLSATNSLITSFRNLIMNSHFIILPSNELIL